MKKKLLYANLSLFLIFGGWTILNWSEIRSFPFAISAYYSKELCSCFFVMELSEMHCHERVRRFIPFSTFAISKEEKWVQTNSLGGISIARYQSKEFGCVLDEYPLAIHFRENEIDTENKSP